MHTTSHTVLVTGGASGIGFALAEKFHAAGNRVIVIGRNKETIAKAAAALPGITTKVADVSVPADREQLVAEFSNLSILVNNAGMQRNLPIVESSGNEIEYELNVNFLAPVLLSRAFLPHLLEREESAIINISSGHKKASLIRRWYPVSFISMFPDILSREKEGLTSNCTGRGKTARHAGEHRVEGRVNAPLNGELLRRRLVVGKIPGVPKIPKP